MTGKKLRLLVEMYSLLRMAVEHDKLAGGYKETAEKLILNYREIMK
jgi:hypothetical protein